ncbi:phosphotransferase [Gammaproteobacteria bacterium]|nr:phosphotransferase [Gammaproteobacteria bacterium]
MQQRIFAQCQALFPDWMERSSEDFEFDDPRGFSSFTMGIRAQVAVTPAAVLYRRLAGKENAILDFATEKNVFLTLGDSGIAARCHHYDEDCRIEAFYRGRSLNADDLFDPQNLRQIADQLYRLHQLTPVGLPQQGFFELLHDKWGRIARRVLEEEIASFPANEQAMCEDLRAIYSEQTRARVQRMLPQGELGFCHNDTYHGNIMKLDTGEIKLVDFEFSCLNHRAYDFANLFAETVMRHQQPDYPYFRIAEPEYGDAELSSLIGYYLDNAEFATPAARTIAFNQLLADSKAMLMMSDYKYAMASLPLALEPIQKIRFIPYAWQRFNKFIAACEQREQQR